MFFGVESFELFCRLKAAFNQLEKKIKLTQLNTCGSPKISSNLSLFAQTEVSSSSRLNSSTIPPPIKKSIETSRNKIAPFGVALPDTTTAKIAKLTHFQRFRILPARKETKFQHQRNRSVFQKQIQRSLSYRKNVSYVRKQNMVRFASRIS